MAYLAATVLEDWHVEYGKSKHDYYEHRLATYGGFQSFVDDTPNLLPADEIAKYKTAEDHVTSIPVIKRHADYSTASTRTCMGKTNTNVSADVDLSWTTLLLGFSMVPSLYKNNYISYLADFNVKMQTLQRTLLSALDVLAYTQLNTDKSAVNNAEDNPYSITSNVMQVGNSEKEAFFNELGQIFLQNDLPQDDINIVASPRTSALVRTLKAQGLGDVGSTAYQMPGYKFYYSRNMTLGSGARDTVFAYPKGSLALLTWIDPDSRMGLSSIDGKEWSVVHLPLLGFDVGLLYQETCADNSTEAGNGFEASKIQKYNFSFDYDFITAYNSDSTTYPGVIYKASILST